MKLDDIRHCSCIDLVTCDAQGLQQDQLSGTHDADYSSNLAGTCVHSVAAGSVSGYTVDISPWPGEQMQHHDELDRCQSTSYVDAFVFSPRRPTDPLSAYAVQDWTDNVENRISVEVESCLQRGVLSSGRLDQGDDTYQLSSEFADLANISDWDAPTTAIDSYLDSSYSTSPSLVLKDGLDVLDLDKAQSNEPSSMMQSDLQPFDDRATTQQNLPSACLMMQWLYTVPSPDNDKINFDHNLREGLPSAGHAYNAYCQAGIERSYAIPLGEQSVGLGEGMDVDETPSAFSFDDEFETTLSPEDGSQAVSDTSSLNNMLEVVPAGRYASHLQVPTSSPKSSTSRRSSGTKRRYNCKTCRIQLADRRGCMRHFLAKHTKYRPLMCSCGKRFMRTDHLRRHERSCSQTRGLEQQAQSLRWRRG